MAKGKVKTGKQVLTEDELLAQALVPEEEQPYPIPENWVWVRLGDVVLPSDDKFSDFSTENEIKYIGLEHIEKDIGIIGYGSANDVRSLKNVFSKGDILYGKLRPYLNKHGLAGFNGICSTDILVLKPSLTAETKFVDYYLNTDKFVEYAIANSKGINLPRVSPSYIINAFFPLPPLPEQRRITECIESLFEKLDHAKELVQIAINSFKTHKAVILHKAFTGQLTVKWRKKHFVDMESWEEKSLGLVLLPTKLKKPDATYFRYIDIDSIDNTVQKVEAPKLLLTKNAPSRAIKEVKKGDTLFSMVRPYLKNIAYVNDSLSDCIASTGFYVCRPSSQVDSVFLYRFLTNDKVIMEINSYMKGDNSPSVRKEDFEKTKILLPSLAEQQEIVRILDSLLEKEHRANDLCDRIKKIDMMKKAILARAFRAMLGTNDPNEESAVGLLTDHI